MKIGTVYRVKARNFHVAVYAGRDQFIGIRTKFNDRYLAAEYDYDNGGSVHPLELVGEIPSGVLLVCYLDTVCEACGYRVEWSGPPAPAPWVHLEARECTQQQPIAPLNQQLFKELEKYDEIYV